VCVCVCVCVCFRVFVCLLSRGAALLSMCVCVCVYVCCALTLAGRRSAGLGAEAPV
jgi:hypothetical protein